MVKFVKVLAEGRRRLPRQRQEVDRRFGRRSKAVAKWSGAKPEDVPAGMALYGFPSADEQASPKWLGGGADGAAAKALDRSRPTS